jgi:hypothetical protein
MSTASSNRIDVVIARYEEPLEFLHAPPFSDWLAAEAGAGGGVRYILYNKGTPLTDEERATYLPPEQGHIYRELPNVGKCDHTYLHHIIRQMPDDQRSVGSRNDAGTDGRIGEANEDIGSYASEHMDDGHGHGHGHGHDSLAQLTLFVPASCMNVDYKRAKTMQTIHTMRMTGNTTFYGFYNPGGLAAIGHFQLQHWTTSDATNFVGNGGESLLQPAPIRPFGAWYRAVFSDMEEEENDVHFICYNGIFAAHREDIMKRPVSFYRKLLEQVEGHSNPEVGHYIERSWVSIFGVGPGSIGKLHLFVW